MASNIDTSNIDENYPVAGIDNNSRGFRDNFASIKGALITAKNELTSIQDSQVQSLMDLGIDDGAAGSILTANGDGTFQFEDPVLVGVLEDLSNVTIDNPSDNQILKYDADTEQWINSDSVVIANLEDLSNVTIDNPSDNQILKYDADTEQWINANSLVDIDSFTTDELAEGDDNLYLTKERYDEFFSEAYSKNTGDLLAINLPNSIEAAASNILPNTIQISNIDSIQSFKAGDNIRIFGASSEQSYLTSPGVIISVLLNGFTEPVDNTYTFGYRICQFNTSTGKISPASDESSASEIDIENFNLTNNITVRIARSSQENGILIYRKLTGPQSTATYNLIAVLGEKEFEGSLSFSFVDYYTFDNTEWSRKNAIRNEFTTSSGVVHFPLTAPAVPKYGWADAEIQTVNYDTGRIVLTENYFLESSLVVSNNDTEFLQDKINSAVELNINSLILAPKTYIISTLSLPTNFTLLGRGSITKLKKLSWSSTDSVNIVTSNVDTTQVTLADMFIDGNMQNQYLKNDSVTQLVNYAVSILGSKNKITNLTIDNVIGGGIFSEDTRELFITFNKITNGSLTDRYESPPIMASGSTEITISNNFIKNFPSALDVSIVDTGILSGNTVSNCGSGILTFGAVKLVSSPNLVLGPAGEYIPGPDIFNSEYDSVNIILQRDMNFISDNYVYQENGSIVDLTANRAFISYKINTLSSLDNVEELGDEILTDGLPPANGVVGTDLAQGAFRFAISKNSIDTLKTTYGYKTLKQADSSHIGLVYRALLTEYVAAGQVVTITGVSPFIPAPITTAYEVVIENLSNVAIGSRVRFLNHGGTLDLNNLVGTVINIENYSSTSKKLRIEYDEPLSVTGDGGFITVENIFTLAKGRIL